MKIQLLATMMMAAVWAAEKKPEPNTVEAAVEEAGSKPAADTGSTAPAKKTVKKKKYSCFGACMAACAGKGGKKGGSAIVGDSLGLAVTITKAKEGDENIDAKETMDIANNVEHMIGDIGEIVDNFNELRQEEIEVEVPVDAPDVAVKKAADTPDGAVAPVAKKRSSRRKAADTTVTTGGNAPVAKKTRSKKPASDDKPATTDGKATTGDKPAAEEEKK